MGYVAAPKGPIRRSSLIPSRDPNDVGSSGGLLTGDDEGLTVGLQHEGGKIGREGAASTHLQGIGRRRKSRKGIARGNDGKGFGHGSGSGIGGRDRNRAGHR